MQEMDWAQGFANLLAEHEELANLRAANISGAGATVGALPLQDEPVSSSAAASGSKTRRASILKHFR